MNRIFDEADSEYHVQKQKFIPSANSHPDEKLEGEIKLKQASKNN